MKKFKNFKTNEAMFGSSYDDDYDDNRDIGEFYSPPPKKSKVIPNLDIDKLKEKKKKEKKIFQVGDILVCINNEQGKLPPEAFEYIKTYKYFKILEINDSLNIDIGYRTEDGKNFFFSPNRFELRDKPKIVDEQENVVPGSATRDRIEKEQKRSDWRYPYNPYSSKMNDYD